MSEILQSDRWHSDDWIKNTQSLLAPIGEKIRRQFHKRENSRDTHKKGSAIYEKSFKGKVARKRTGVLRRKRVKSFYLTQWEKKMIEKFYHDCPEGFHVDHIIPIAKGGEHTLKNMQWIAHHLNAIKHVMIIPPLSEYPHCRLDLQEILMSI